MSRTKDYAKKFPKKKSTEHRPRQKGLSLWLIAFIASVFFVLGLYYLSTQKVEPTSSTQKSIQKPKAKPKPKPIVIAEPRFEFYEVLPTMTVPSRSKNSETKVSHPIKPSDEKIDTAKKAIKDPAVIPGQYLVQVAAVNQEKDAEDLKAQLILLGFDVRIQSIQNAKGHFFRVILGPYANLNQAVTTQNALKTHHFDSFISHSR